jgi:hypothetical protein
VHALRTCGSDHSFSFCVALPSRAVNLCGTRVGNRACGWGTARVSSGRRADRSLFCLFATCGDPGSYCGCRVRAPGCRCSCSGRARRSACPGSGLVYPGLRAGVLASGTAGWKRWPAPRPAASRPGGRSPGRAVGPGWRRPGSPARCSSRRWHPGPCARTACACCRLRSLPVARIADVRPSQFSACGWARKA